MISYLPHYPVAFPSPEEADEDGLLAVGGDLSVPTLIKAYSAGIFPWYNEDSPILWWSPDPRFILLPENLNVSKSLGRTIRSGKFSIAFDRDFASVIEYCSKVPRKGEDGTWITDEMKKAYINFHKAGYAHSVEVYLEDKIVGGLYGVAMGRVFFGESMFHLEKDASKVALYHLVERVKKLNFHFIDAQVPTDHMKRMGAAEISRKEFTVRLKHAISHSVCNSWNSQ
jgi:leucyl/phenylalanyl-tRNA--protein transferase